MHYKLQYKQICFNPSNISVNFDFLKICFSSQRVMRLAKLVGAIERHLKDINIFKRQCNNQAHEGEILTNLVSFYNKATHQMDEGKVVGVVFQCFGKDFDTVSHSILLDKLFSYKTRKLKVCWMKNQQQQGSEGCREWGCVWLATRHQRCSSGLHQGHFSIFINDVDCRS